MVSKRAQINQVAASKSCYWQTLLRIEKCFGISVMDWIRDEKKSRFKYILEL